MPHIISESGRALTAHHALLLLKVIDVESQVAVPPPELDGGRPPLLHEMVEDYDVTNLDRQERARGLPRRHVRQGARPAALQQRRPVAARARDGRARSTSRRVNRIAQLAQLDRDEYARSSAGSSTPRSSTATSATSRSSSRCPTAGRSTSSSRSCRSTGWTRSRMRRGHACRTSPATRTARSTASSATRTDSRAWSCTTCATTISLHARHLPHRRVSGDPRRPAQPVRRHERGAHPARA